MRPLLAAAAALVLWLVFCLFYHPPRIESALYGASAEALEVAGLSGVRPEVDGRDVALVGTVESTDERSQAERAIGAVVGVVTVENRLEVASLILPHYLEIESWPEGVKLRGTMPSEDRREVLLTLARELYGADRVEARLEVDAEARDGAALTRAAEVLTVLAGNRHAIQARLDGDSLRLSGTVASIETRKRIEEQAQAAAPRVRLFFSAIVVPTEPQKQAL